MGTATPTDSINTPGALDAAAASQGSQGSNSRCSSGASSGQLSEQEGLLARCVHQLYSSIAGRQGSVQCSVTLSCVELYNENVTDLLCSKKNQQLQVRPTSSAGLHVVRRNTAAP
jgi:hypothetical protein